MKGRDEWGTRLDMAKFAPVPLLGTVVAPVVPAASVLTIDASVANWISMGWKLCAEYAFYDASRRAKMTLW